MSDPIKSKPRMKTGVPWWIAAFVVVFGRPPRRVWLVVERRRNQGDSQIWERALMAWPWLWLAKLHAEVVATRMRLSGTSEFVERVVMVVEAWVTDEPESDSP